MNNERNHPGDAGDDLTGSDLSPHVEAIRGAFSSLEQIMACLDRLSPGARRRTFERLPELLGETADSVHDLRRIVTDYLRRRYP